MFFLIDLSVKLEIRTAISYVRTPSEAGERPFEPYFLFTAIESSINVEQQPLNLTNISV
jgi:hypothetical protein